MERLSGFLTPDQRTALRHVLHRAGRTAVEHGRAHALLLLDQGRSVPEVAQIMFLDEQSIRNWLERFRDGQEDNLFRDRHGGRTPALNEEQRKQLADLLDQHLHATTSSVIECVRHLFGVIYSISGMNALLHGMGFVYKKPKHVPGKADPAAQAEFARRFHELMANKEPETLVFFTDAVHPTHNSTPAHGWIRKGRDVELPANSGRDRLNLQGALNAETHEVVVERSQTVNAEAVIGLLSRIESAYPEAERILLIADNAKYYHSRVVKEYLASRGGKIDFWFLPPYSPNLNLIERLWKFMRSQVMNNRYYATFREFSEEALMFFECLSDHADKLRTLLTQRFHLFSARSTQRVCMAC